MSVKLITTLVADNKLLIKIHYENFFHSFTLRFIFTKPYACFHVFRALQVSISQIARLTRLTQRQKDELNGVNKQY